MYFCYFLLFQTRLDYVFNANLSKTLVLFKADVAST